MFIKLSGTVEQKLSSLILIPFSVIKLLTNLLQVKTRQSIQTDSLVAMSISPTELMNTTQEVDEWQLVHGTVSQSVS